MDAGALVDLQAAPRASGTAGARSNLKLVLTCPSMISSTVGFTPPEAYLAACSKSEDVDMNASSAPPLLPVVPSCVHDKGSFPPCPVGTASHGSCMQRVKVDLLELN